jgi:hypothetical protein
MKFPKTLLTVMFVLIVAGWVRGGDQGDAPQKGDATVLAEPSKETDPLKTRVTLSKVEDGDVITALNEIISQTSFLSFEVLGDSEDAQAYRAKDTALPQGDCTIEDVLQKLKSRQEATWKVEGSRIHVRIQLARDFENPLDKELPEAIKGKFTRIELIKKLNAQISDLKILLLEGRIVGTTPTSKDFSFNKGAKVRDVLADMARAWGVGWGAEVYSQPKQYEIKDVITGETHKNPGERIRLVFGKEAVLVPPVPQGAPNKSNSGK